tara:strand:- start:184 stop:630 length:447 start_codon:yes stop_codon:yes gene_type:complete
MSKKIITFIFFLFITFSVQANTKIAFVDIDFLFENSKVGLSIKKKLENIDLKNSKILKNKEKKIIDEENEIKKLQNIISKEEFDKKIGQLKISLKNYNEEKKIILKEFKNTQNSELKIFFEKINPFLLSYMSEKSIDLLIEKKKYIYW